METADLIVIGSGQGGVPLAADFAKAGKHVVLLERDALGGSYINYGCTPSKAFLAAAHAAGRARQATKLGIHTSVGFFAFAKPTRAPSDASRSNLHPLLQEVLLFTPLFAEERFVVQQFLERLRNQGWLKQVG